MGMEFEVKFSATEEILEAIGREYSGFRQIRMHTTYYDDPQLTLSKNHCTWRLRQENDLSVCTLKIPRPDGSRSEWECLAPTIEAGASAIAQLAGLSQGPWHPVCGAEFTRLAATVSTGDGTAELALDMGVLLGSGKKMPLCEVEVEYKSGDPQATLDFAQALGQRFGLTREPRSKFARAMALAEGGNHG